MKPEREHTQVAAGLPLHTRVAVGLPFSHSGCRWVAASHSGCRWVAVLDTLRLPTGFAVLTHSGCRFHTLGLPVGSPLVCHKYHILSTNFTNLANLGHVLKLFVMVTATQNI